MPSVFPIRFARAEPIPCASVTALRGPQNVCARRIGCQFFWRGSLPGVVESRASSPLGSSDAVPLAHALASHIGDLTDTRVLAVKGPVAAHFGLRGAHQSADVDVLIGVEGEPAFVEGLGLVGWSARPVSWLSNELVLHSRAFVSEQWPCDIDVHTAFPGFLADPSHVFEALWERREEITLGGRRVACTDRLSSILIASLHGLRTPNQAPRHRREVQYLADVVIPSLTESEFRQLKSLAGSLGSIDTARPVFIRRAQGLPEPTPAGVDEALDDWRFRTASGGVIAAQAVNAFRHAGPRDKLRVARESVWRSGSELALDHPEVEPTFRARTRARWVRFTNGLRSIRSLIRGYRYMKKGKDDTALVDGEYPW